MAVPTLTHLCFRGLLTSPWLTEFLEGGEALDPCSSPNVHIQGFPNFALSRDLVWGGALPAVGLAPACPGLGLALCPG